MISNPSDRLLQSVENFKTLTHILDKLDPAAGITVSVHHGPDSEGRCCPRVTVEVTELVVQQELLRLLIAVVQSNASTQVDATRTLKEDCEQAMAAYVGSGLSSLRHHRIEPNERYRKIQNNADPDT